MFNGLKMGFWLRVWNNFPVYKLTRKNTQPEIMCDIVFDKAKGRGGTVNRTSVYAEAAVQRVL